MVINRHRWLIGVDEAGRGPLAGPVAVGIVKVPRDFDWGLIEGVGDSKKVSPKRRGVIFKRAKELKKEGKLDFLVLMGSAKEIDKNGIAVVIRGLIAQGVQTLKLKPADCFIMLDGSLKAPTEFKQETIIKGDQKELVIGLASICAKETRDASLCQLAKKYPRYGLEIHKGYGTKVHREAISQYGCTVIHRVSYCKNIKIR